MMEKVLVNVLKGLGITPELIVGKIEEMLQLARGYDAKLDKISAENIRITALLSELQQKKGNENGIADEKE